MQMRAAEKRMDKSIRDNVNQVLSWHVKSWNK